eukprot:12239-Heterococcus_DN1.PRE.3
MIRTAHMLSLFASTVIGERGPTVLMTNCCRYCEQLHAHTSQVRNSMHFRVLDIIFCCSLLSAVLRPSSTLWLRQYLPTMATERESRGTSRPAGAAAASTTNTGTVREPVSANAPAHDASSEAEAAAALASSTAAAAASADEEELEELERLEQQLARATIEDEEAKDMLETALSHVHDVVREEQERGLQQRLEQVREQHDEQQDREAAEKAKAKKTPRKCSK